jgi:hypothetical protein
MNSDFAGEPQADRSASGMPPPDEATMRRGTAQCTGAGGCRRSVLWRPWMGNAPTVADLAVYHPLWFLTARTQRLAFELEPFGRIAAWMARVRDFGHGDCRYSRASDRDRVPRGPTDRRPCIRRIRRWAARCASARTTTARKW